MANVAVNLAARRRESLPAPVLLLFTLLSRNASAGRRPAGPGRQLAVPFIVAGALVLQTAQLERLRVRDVDGCGGHRPRLCARHRRRGIAFTIGGFAGDPSLSRCQLRFSALGCLDRLRLPTPYRRCGLRPRIASSLAIRTPYKGAEGLAGLDLRVSQASTRRKTTARSTGELRGFACSLASPFRPSTSVTQEN